MMKIPILLSARPSRVLPKRVRPWHVRPRPACSGRGSAWPAFAFALTLLLGAQAPSALHADEAAWSALDRLRTTLESRSPLTVDFEQSLVPEGFLPDDVEAEAGQLAVDLPRCLRWDYLGDFAKSFLLCDDEAHYWNPGEPAGQIFSVNREEDAPGLDFFLRTTDELRERYRAATSRAQDGETELVVVELVPLRPSDDVVDLEVRLDPVTGLMQQLSYRDVEGNRTTFVLTEYRGGAPSGAFTAPKDMIWERQ